jgi:hypothetical protein
VLNGQIRNGIAGSGIAEKLYDALVTIVSFGGVDSAEKAAELVLCASPSGSWRPEKLVVSECASMSGKWCLFPDKNIAYIYMKSLENQIVRKIYGNGRGWAFSRKDFTLLGGAESVDRCLSRLAAKGTIRRLTRGLYDYPQYSRWLGQTLGPDMDQAAHALARKFGWHIQVTGNAALNILGLSTQVPTQYLYLSDGPSKTYNLLGAELGFQKARYTHLGVKRADSALLVQAIHALGQGGISPEHTRAMARYLTPEPPLPDKTCNAIAKDTQYVTSWVQAAIVQVLKAAAEAEAA